MAERELSILVRAKGALKAASDIGKVDSKIQGLGRQVSKGLGVGAGIAVADRAFYALGRTVGRIPELIGEATQAFIEDEQSQALLRTSLRANVTAWDENLSAIERVIAARQKLGFTDEEQRESLAALVVGFGNVADALEAERNAMDLARFSGASLAEASDVLLKVHAGNFRALKTLGINTDNVTTETEALAAIYKVATGQAESFAQTLSGRLLVAQIKSAEATERLGQGTAELSADFEEFKAGSIEKFALGLDFLTDALNFQSQATERQIELWKIYKGLGLVPAGMPSPTSPSAAKPSMTVPTSGVPSGVSTRTTTIAPKITANIRVPVTVNIAGISRTTTGTTLTRVGSFTGTAGTGALLGM